MLRRRYSFVVGAALSIGLALPFAARQNSWFEWANPYWLLLLQRENIVASGLPSYFIHTTETGIYYPVHLFYAGFTVSLLAYVAVLVPPSLVFSASIAASFFAAFVGITWLARALGVGAPTATAAAALYIANPQYVAKMYARGAWAEFVAVSMLTLVIGSAVRAMVDRRDGRTAVVPTAFIAIGTLFLAGTHNLTLALGLPLVAVFVVASAWVLHQDLRAAACAVVSPAFAVAVGLAISAVFTIPNVWLSGRTAITGWTLEQTELNTVSAVFRPHPTSVQAAVNEVPSLLLVPIVLLGVATFAQRPRRAGVTRAIALAVPAAFVALVLTVLTTRGSLWANPNSILHRVVPEKAIRTIQFPSRLTAFLALALVVVLVSLAASAANVRFERAGQVAVMVAAAWYVSLGLVLAFGADRTSVEGFDEMSYGVVDAVAMPISFAGGEQSQQTQFLLTEGGVAIDRPSRIVTFDLDGHVDPNTPIEPDSVVATNVVWSPLVRFTGAELLGRDERGMSVIVTRSSASEALAATTRTPPSVLLGAIVSLLGLGVAAWWLAVEFTKRRAMPDV